MATLLSDTPLALLIFKINKLKQSWAEHPSNAKETFWLDQALFCYITYQARRHINSYKVLDFKNLTSGLISNTKKQRDNQKICLKK